MKVIQLHKSEQKLIEEALKNNRNAQRKLYERYVPTMLSVCRQYIRDIHHAEDVLVIGFTKVFKYLKTYKGEGSFEGWIRRIMIRECITFLRKKKKLEILTDEFPESKTPIAFEMTEFEVNDIQKVIDELPEGYRMVFLMHAVEGYKHEEIASSLDISVGTSKSQLYKARKMLREKINNLNKLDHGAR